MKGIEPRDQVEAMLAAQMATTHSAIMTFARRLNNVENIPQQDSTERAYNKLARTFAAQVEALKRYRSAGEQTVRGRVPQKSETTHERGLSLSEEPAMLGYIEAHQAALYGPRGEWLDSLSFPWRSGRGAQGQAQRYRHGNHTEEAEALRRRVFDLHRQSRALLRRLNP